LIAYIQRLGTDITKPAPAAIDVETGEPPAEQEATEDEDGVQVAEKQ
jgi:hypothetical protein